MPNLRVLCRDHPQRSIVLAAGEHGLFFTYRPTIPADRTSLYGSNNETSRCSVEFSATSRSDLKGYKTLAGGFGTLGLINLDEDIFICVITEASRTATARPGETIWRIDNVDFCTCSLSCQNYLARCLTRDPQTVLITRTKTIGCFMNPGPSLLSIGVLSLMGEM